MDDVWEAYTWIVNYAERWLGISPKKIILAGDSAGGNLCLGIALRCIEAGFRKPDALILAYPAVSIDVRKFTPSYFISINDLIVPHSFLKM